MKKELEEMRKKLAELEAKMAEEPEKETDEEPGFIHITVEGKKKNVELENINPSQVLECIGALIISCHKANVKVGIPEFLSKTVLMDTVAKALVEMEDDE